MSSNDHRKCAKCGKTKAEDKLVSYHRFPDPGKNNILKALAWAKYCWPDEEWAHETLVKLSTSCKVLCGRHFASSQFYDSERQKLTIFAVPDAADVEDLLKERDDVFKQVVFTARGLVPPVFTILNDDRTINYPVIPLYAKYLAEKGIKSVLVGGTTGEHMSLSVADRKKIIDAWVAAGNSYKLHVMVQVGGAPMADVLDLAQHSQKVGADSLLTLPELYFKPTSVQELVFYVGEVAKAAPKLPVLYYHIPAWSKVEINMPAFVAAATNQIPNFKGIKFTSNDLSEAAQVLRTLKEDQEIFLGADTLLAPAALLGIRSSIGTTFNLFPELAAAILAAVDSNDVAKARALQEKLCLAIEAITAEGPWVPAMKAAMVIATAVRTGPPALPEKPISSEASARIETKLKALGL